MKIKKLLGKAISLMLAVVFVFQLTAGFAMAQSVSAGIIHHEVFDEYGRLQEQIYEADGNIFFFRMTETYTYASQLTQSGMYAFGFKDNVQHLVYAGSFSVDDVLMLCQPDTITENNTQETIDFVISSLVIANIDVFATDVIVMDDMLVGAEENAAPRLWPNPDPRGVSHLRSTFGYPADRSHNFISSMNSGGVNARLYQSTSFHRMLNINVPRFLVSLAAGITAAAVASILGVTIPVAATLARFTVTGAGAYLILSLRTDVFYENVRVSLDRFVVINGQVRFEQARATEYRILFTDTGVGHNLLTSFVTPHFNNTVFMLQEGIRRHNNNIWTTW